MSGRTALDAERFLRDIATHQMEVLRDDGLQRHLRFQAPGSTDMHFDLITWPGYLCFTGDMGTYVFRRLKDMFTFFRPADNACSSRDPLENIDHQNWAEKLEATDKGDGHSEFDPRAFKREIAKQRFELVRGPGRNWKKDERREMWDELDEVMNKADEGEAQAIVALQEWFYQPRRYEPGCCPDGVYLETSDFPSCKTYTYRFLWCCYALRWGVQRYDAWRATQAPTPPFPYASEMMKVLDAAWTGDTKKAGAYANLIADKMAQAGQPEQAAWLREYVEVLEGNRKPVRIHPAGAADPTHNDSPMPAPGMRG